MMEPLEILASLQMQRLEALNDPELIPRLTRENLTRALNFTSAMRRGEDLSNWSLLIDPIDLCGSGREPEEDIRTMLDNVYHLAHARPEEATMHRRVTEKGRVWITKRIPTAAPFVFDELGMYMWEEKPGNLMGFRVLVRLATDTALLGQPI